MRDECRRSVTLLSPPAPPDPGISERDLQQCVVELARWLGWEVWHDNDSRRNDAGWPDLVLVRDERMVIAELKTQRGRLRAAQRHWMRLLLRVRGVEYYLWRPSSWSRIVEVLAE